MNFFDDFYLPSVFEESGEFDSLNFVSELWEDEDNYYVRAELPGMKKDRIRVDLGENNELRVDAEKSEERESKDKRYHFSEISYGSFSRVFPLSRKEDAKNIKVKYEEQSLSITVPKSKESKVQRTINVE